MFLRFDRAFVHMFGIAAGEPWLDVLQVIGDDGNVDYDMAVYIFSFILIVAWTLLQV